MKVAVKIPQQGLTVEYVVLTEWKKQVGEHVSLDETLAEIESEKAVLELESPADGVLSEIIGEPGEEYDIGEVIGYIETEG